MKRLAPALGLLLALGIALARPAPEPRWWRGNTHTHTLWSDGDAAPEAVVDWYASHDYDFLVLSDHDILADHERWMAVGEGERISPAHVIDLVQRFGSDAVELRRVGAGQQMRLRTLAELKAEFEEPGEFLLMPGEEVSAHDGRVPVHINALNTASVIRPVRGEDALDTLQKNLEAIEAHGRENGRAVLAHLNHPNFHWAFTVEQLAGMRGERFFEVYNGHPAVNNEGDAQHPSMERMWDEANTLRLSELGLPPLYALATDDAHNYHRSGPDQANVGRGWIQVRASSLDPEQLIGAMRAGDFYASSGVELESVERVGDELRVRVAAREGERCTVSFRGTRRTADGLGPAGQLLLSTAQNPAVYRMRGDELYVRATVVSNLPQEHPDPAGGPQRAWTQPVLP